MDTLMSLLGNEASFEIEAGEENWGFIDQSEVAAKIDTYSNAIDLLSSQIESVENAIESLEKGGVKMNAAGLGVFTASLQQLAPAVIQGDQIGFLLSCEDNGTGSVTLSTESIKEKLVGAKEKAKDLLAKVINFIADFWRKFRTNTDKLVKDIDAKIEMVNKSSKNEIKVKPSKGMYIGKELAKPADFTDDPTVGKGFYLPGGKEVSIKKNGVKVVDAGVKPPSEITISKADMVAYLEGAKKTMVAVGKIDHRAITKELELATGLGRELMKEMGQGDKISTPLKGRITRLSTYTIPMLYVKMAKEFVSKASEFK